MAAAVLLHVLAFAVTPVSASHSPGGHRAEFVRQRSREPTVNATLPLLGQGLVQMTIQSEQTSDVEEYSFVLYNKAVDDEVKPAFTIRVFSESVAAAMFNGPVAGLGIDDSGESLDRCGDLRGADDMGATSMCEGTTKDGKLHISLAEMEGRCAADEACAGFSQNTEDGAPYFRPQQNITAIVDDFKWTTWTKGSAGVSITINDNSKDRSSRITNQTILKELQRTVPWAPDDLVKFSQSSIEVWVSVDKKNGYIRFGYGYPLLENTMVQIGPLHSCLTDDFVETCPIYNISTVGTTTLGKVEHAVTKFPIVNPEPHLLVDSQQNTLEILSDRSAVVPATLPAELQELYALVAGDKVAMTVDDAKAIDHCVKTEGCILHKILKDKANESEFGDPEMVYVRATIGPDLGNSPGSPLVVEIWPPHCYSPIHDHADTVAVIKVLSGTITSTFYNPLAEYRNGKPVPLREGDVSKGQVTYLTPELFQTHMLKNNKNDSCITIQSYYYLNSNYVHNETFHYTESSPTDAQDDPIPNWDGLHLFNPGSDIQYEDALQQARAFWILKPALPSEKSEL